MQKAYCFTPILIPMTRKAILLVFLLGACQSDPENEADKTKNSPLAHTGQSSGLDSRTNLNISILIDLSDRIDPQKYPNPTMEYYQRDTGYIASVVKAFDQHVVNKKLIMIDDRLQTFIDPLPQNPEIVKNLEALKVELNRNNASKEILYNLPTTYTRNASALYQQAIKDNIYVGSDTWRFFKSSVSDYCLKEGAHNVLVILTDGYMYHPNSMINEGGRTTTIHKNTFKKLKLNSPDWQSEMREKDMGFYAAPVELEGLKVLVLGLNPSADNPFEEDVLRAYWQKWLVEMGVAKENILVKRADLPVNLDEPIRDFILSPSS